MSRNRYPKELREEIVRLALEGHSIQSLARAYEPCAMTIRKWVDATRREMKERGLGDPDETARLHARIRQLETDNAILKKAAAWFAKESL